MLVDQLVRLRALAADYARVSQPPGTTPSDEEREAFRLYMAALTPRIVLELLDQLDAVLVEVCDSGQSDERIDALRLLLVGRCEVCGEPAVTIEPRLCWHHQAESTALSTLRS